MNPCRSSGSPAGPSAAALTFIFLLPLLAAVTAFPFDAAFAEKNAAAVPRPAPGAALEAELVAIPGAAFEMGDKAGEPDEVPRTVRVGPFRIMRLEVSNRQFAAYMRAAYPRGADSAGKPTDVQRSGAGYVWERGWALVKGADWRHPFGPGGQKAQPSHPVVQVSQRDAARFCAFHGLRLPTDEEWELAARGTDGRRYPWGNGPPRAPGGQGRGRANFGTVPCCAPDASDGYRYFAPVGSFPGGASPYGILDMAGNVWEWTASPFPGKPKEVTLRGGGWGNNPYCLRTSYRHGNPPDIGLNMVGFRCAADASP